MTRKRGCGKCRHPWKAPQSKFPCTALVLTNMELDEGGHVLDAETWQKRRQQLQEVGGA